ncbi:MAG TPA: lysylphosphatidylglycerol synthase transmembrane domain-containing protein [Gaiellaceae bacterium]|nr:lysylphosphatidylglycerol synthase transmembrane domain-containing protein [Gaiellaceae bacterium]
MAVSASGQPAHFRPRRVLEVSVGVASVALVFVYLLPKIADYGQVWAVVGTLSLPWIVVLAVASALFILSDAPPWLTVLPGLRFFDALRMDLAGSALSQVVPGGTAVNVATQYGMLRNWGFQGRPVVLAVSVTTLWSQFATFGFPVLAITALSLDGGHDPTLRKVAVAGLVVVAALAGVLVAILWRPRLADRLGDSAAGVATRLNAIVHKGPARWSGADLVRFRSEAIDLLRHRWAALTVATLVNQLTVFAVLVVSLRAFGITRPEVDVIEAFAAWSLSRALGSIPITPGGLGVQEVALSAALVGFGAHNAVAVAATLVYRALTFIPSVVLGLVSAATYNLGRPQPHVAPEGQP